MTSFLEQQAAEAAVIESAGRYVDPRDEAYDDTGYAWKTIGFAGGFDRSGSTQCGFADEQQLADARAVCRHFAESNPYAINAHENRVNYVVGGGHGYHAAGVGGYTGDEIAAVQSIIDEFLRRNNWSERQQESVRRLDRDGEVFLRFFRSEESNGSKPDGGLIVRFVEPAQVASPQGVESAPFGVLTDPHDVETVRGYYVDGVFVDATEIQHRKHGVDVNVRRGVPLFWGCRVHLKNASHNLLATAARIRIAASIGALRKHKGVGQSAVESFRAGRAGALAGVQDPASGVTRNFERLPPGSVLDVSANTDYEFPGANTGIDQFEIGQKMVLRAIAAHVQMPEYMLSADASNGNFSSTLVAESPAIKSFERLQSRQSAFDLAVVDRAIDYAIHAGRLPADVRDRVSVVASLPQLQPRDTHSELLTVRQKCEIGVVSPQTVAAELGLNYDDEQAKISAFRAAGGVWPPSLSATADSAGGDSATSTGGSGVNS